MKKDAPAGALTQARPKGLFAGWAARESLWMAAYWPVYGLLFYLLERVCRPERYHVMYTALDDVIPFHELFVIPYVFWFLYLIGIHCYTAKRDAAAFRRLMAFVAVSHTCALAIFFLFPTCQHLRPLVFPRDNVLTDIVAFFYRIDTSPNVCPSLHVVGSMAVWYGAKDTKLLAHRGWRVFFLLATASICLSTVVLKQHSVVDVMGSMLMAYGLYPVIYGHQFAGERGNVRPRRAFTLRRSA